MTPLFKVASASSVTRWVENHEATELTEHENTSANASRYIPPCTQSSACPHCKVLAGPTALRGHRATLYALPHYAGSPGHGAAFAPCCCCHHTLWYGDSWRPDLFSLDPLRSEHSFPAPAQRLSHLFKGSMALPFSLLPSLHGVMGRTQSYLLGAHIADLLYLLTLLSSSLFTPGHRIFTESGWC